jgi:hypothetical protein
MTRRILPLEGIIEQSKDIIYINEELPILHFEIWLDIMSFIDITDIKTLLKILILSRNSYLYIEKHIKNLLYPIIQYRKYNIGPSTLYICPSFSIISNKMDNCMKFQFFGGFRDLKNYTEFSIKFEPFYKISDLISIETFMKFIIKELYDETTDFTMNRFFEMIEYINKKSFNIIDHHHHHDSSKIIHICSLIFSILNLSLKHAEYNIIRDVMRQNPRSDTPLKYIYNVDKYSKYITPLYKLDKIKVIDRTCFITKLGYKSSKVYYNNTTTKKRRQTIIEDGLYSNYIKKFDLKQYVSHMNTLIQSPIKTRSSIMLNNMLNDYYIEIKDPTENDQFEDVVLLLDDNTYFHVASSDRYPLTIEKCFVYNYDSEIHKINIYYILLENYNVNIKKVFKIINYYYNCYYKMLIK